MIHDAAHRNYTERNRDAKDLRILTLVDEGMSQRKIAAMVGCAKSHVYDLAKAAKGNEGLMNAELKRA